MNLLSCILVVVAVGSISTSVYLYSELDTARHGAGARTAPCRDEQAQIAVLRRARDALELEATEGEGLLAGDPTGDSVESAIERPNRDARASPLDTPEFQAAPAGPGFGARHEAALRWIYRRVAEELNLSPDEEAALLALLLQHQTEQIETARRFARDRTAMTQAMNELRQGNETELMSLLGDRYLEFEDYQKSLGERMQIEQAALQLEAAGVPLEEAQRTRLLAAMVEEHDRFARPTWAAEIGPQENIARLQAWHEAYEERVRDRASSVLRSDQLKQYDVYLNLRSRQRRSQLETWRESAAARSSLGRTVSPAASM